MSDNTNWRMEIDASDYFGHQKKKAQVEQRRPVIRRASDLVGPGIGPEAVRITDFNNLLAQFNGYFSAAAGALNAPTATGSYVGTVVNDPVLGGIQTFTNLDTTNRYQRVFRRNPGDASTIYWTVWVQI